MALLAHLPCPRGGDPLPPHRAGGGDRWGGGHCREAPSPCHPWGGGGRRGCAGGVGALQGGDGGHRAAGDPLLLLLLLQGEHLAHCGSRLGHCGAWDLGQIRDRCVGQNLSCWAAPGVVGVRESHRQVPLNLLPQHWEVQVVLQHHLLLQPGLQGCGCWPLLVLGVGQAVLRPGLQGSRPFLLLLVPLMLLLLVWTLRTLPAGWLMRWWAKADGGKTTVPAQIVSIQKTALKNRQCTRMT